MMDFDSTQAALEKLGATADAAESHGTLCGLLLDNAGFPDWLGHTIDDLPEKADVLANEHLAVLQALFEQTREQINTTDMTFELLLPDESDDFGVRLLGLSTWCQGFLYGVGVIGSGRTENLDEQAAECLADMLAISQLDYREDNSDEAELQFAEVAEHVRMSVIMLNESINPVLPSPQLQ